MSKPISQLDGNQTLQHGFDDARSNRLKITYLGKA